jgi:DNA-binding response OmpR family regulator
MARILLVDDEVGLLGLLETVLQMDGHEVVTAQNGREALAAAADPAIQLVITDLIMPDTEGIETIVTLRKSRPELPIIAMSGGGRGSASDYLEIAEAVGASATLAKPFATHVFLDAVNTALRA